MIKDLLDQVNLLEVYYQTGQGLYKKKQVKEHEKRKKKCQQLMVQMKLCKALGFNYLLLTQDGLLIMSNPNTDFGTIMGNIRCNTDSFCGRIHDIKYDFDMQIIQVKHELQNLGNISNSGVQRIYGSFSDKEAQRALEVLTQFRDGEKMQFLELYPYLGQQNWAEVLLKDEELPTQLFKVELTGDKPALTYIYNSNYVKLLGIMPNLLIEIMLRDQKFPEPIDESPLFLWNQRVSNNIKSYKEETVNFYDSFVMTYEGMRVAVQVKETYQCTFDQARKMFIFLQKTQYVVKNRKVLDLLFEKNRIKENSLEYILENQVFDKNQIIHKQLLGEKDNDMTTICKPQKQCGYRERMIQEMEFWI